MDIKQEVKARGQKKKKERFPITSIKKVFCTAAGSILFAEAVAAGIYILPSKTTTVEEAQYTYKTIADVSYKVKLLPNELFEKDWMEEGGLYSTRLTDSIETRFTADFIGSSPESVLGNYNITGIVEGYQDIKDSKKIIYERKFPIREGKALDNGQGGASVSEVVSVAIEPYKQAAEQAESILGATSARRFYLLFEGNFISDTQYGKAEERFSLALQIPILKQDGFYEISKPGTFSKTGQITSAKKITVAANPVHIVLIVIWGALSLTVILWALFFTRKPNAEEYYRLKCKELMRKYGSRMIQLKQIDKEWAENTVAVADMDNLVMISEEIHRPICYSLDENGLPKSGILYVPDGEKYYVLYLQDNPTTLVVDIKAESST